MGHFKLLHNLQAYDKIPVSEYKSEKTGLTVVIAEVDGPVVNGYFCLVTETFDDDGLPHTLEHLVFLGSEDYPYKGVLDLLANRCLASGTNAWTAVDHTCYTMETAGSEGFLTLMPIYLEHILYPVLTDEAFVTEVHHITEEGQDAGVVYSEMQGRENSAISRLRLKAGRTMYPGKCGYSSEPGGIMKNLRESTDNTKVRNYHKAFYRPENLKIIISGQVKHEDVFNALAKFEEKIIAKGARRPFMRPWQNPVPPLAGDSKDLIIKYPADEESNGMFCMVWRGPSAVTDLYTITAINLLFMYLTESSISPLKKKFVEIEQPFASDVSHMVDEYSESSIYLFFEDVPLDKLGQLRPKVVDFLKQILVTKDIDLQRMSNIINKFKLQSLKYVENEPHKSVTSMLISQMIYGNTKEDLQQRANPFHDISRLAKEPQQYWLNLLKKYCVENKFIALQCAPSKEEQASMTKEETERVQAQINALGASGLKQKADLLKRALEYNERTPPQNMIASVQVPSLRSIKFHNITRYSTDSGTKHGVDFSKTPIFTYFDHLKTSFVYMFALLDTSAVPTELRSYLPLFFETLQELPIERNGKIIPYEDIVKQLNEDTISSSTSIGLGGSSFLCGAYSLTCNVSLVVEASKYEVGLRWLKEFLYKTVFTVDRLKVSAMKINNAVAQVKQAGESMISYAMKGMCYSRDSNMAKNGVLHQGKFLTELISQMEKGDGKDVVDKMEKLRKIITEPSNVVLYIAGNLDLVKEPAKPIKDFLPSEYAEKPQKLIATPSYKLLDPNAPINGCVIGMGSLESSFIFQTTNSITSHSDPDLPALMLYLQYLTQTEGPLWKQIRGKGLSYSYTMVVNVEEGLLYLAFTRATNPVGAYKEAEDIVKKQLRTKIWEKVLLESARSSLIFEMINKETTVMKVVNLSIFSYFQDVDYKYNRTFLELINKVTLDDLIRVGEKYVAPLFDPSKTRTAIVSNPSKTEEIATEFKKLGFELKVYPSLEESFLNEI